MIYSIDSMHLNHVPYAVHSEFSSASSVQQLIIPEQLNQIYIVRHRWKEQILSFPTILWYVKINFHIPYEATAAVSIAKGTST